LTERIVSYHMMISLYLFYLAIQCFNSVGQATRRWYPNLWKFWSMDPNSAALWTSLYMV